MEQIIYYIVIGVLLIGSVALFILGGKREAARSADKKLQEAVDFKALLGLIYEALPNLVTEAEELYADGTGVIKRSFVIQKVLELLPDGLKSRLDVEQLGVWIDVVLEKMRPLWAESLDGLMKNVE